MGHPLLNCTSIRDFTFAALPTHRPALVKKMRRIGDSFFDALEYRVRAKVVADVLRCAKTDFKTLRHDTETPPEPRTETQQWLVNQTHLDTLARSIGAEHGLTQVAGDYLAACDVYLGKVIISKLLVMPSVGSTIN